MERHRTALTDRIHLASGAVVLAGTATVWITRTREFTVESLGDQSYASITDTDAHSLWQIFSEVNPKIVALFGFGVLMILGFCAAAILLPGRAVIVLPFAILAALTAFLVMMLSDNDYGAGPGAWLTLIVCALVAVADVIALATNRSAEPSGAIR